MISVGFFLYIVKYLTFFYIIFWVFPYIFQGLRASYGDEKYILFMDEQLSKHPNRRESMIPSLIGARHHIYSILLPFIFHRVTTKSIKFKVIMWLNCLWFWSVGIFIAVSSFYSFT